MKKILISLLAVLSVGTIIYFSLNRKTEQPVRSVDTSQLFEVIMSEPVTSSTTADYLRIHETEYQQLLDDEAGTLDYIFTEFLNAEESGNGLNDLRGALLWTLLDELAPEARVNQPIALAQQYFDAWRTQAVEMQKANGNDWLKENQPAMYQLLEKLARQS